MSTMLLGLLSAKWQNAISQRVKTGPKQVAYTCLFGLCLYMISLLNFDTSQVDPA